MGTGHASEHDEPLDGLGQRSIPALARGKGALRE